jgi:hypothetical protein
MCDSKPRIGVFKFASCGGCQLTILDCEDELLDLAGRVDIAFFQEAIRWPCHDLICPAALGTHGFRLIEVLRLAETLALLPPRVEIYTIEAAEISPAAVLSPAVSAGIDQLVKVLLRRRRHSWREGLPYNCGVLTETVRRANAEPT